MKKTVCLICLILATCLLFSNVALATEIMPRADAVFMAVYPSLLTSQQVTFQAFTYETKSFITVVECWLEQKIDGEWQKVCDLEPPNHTEYNTFSYSCTVSYASYIGYGTFRVWATFNTDGYEVSRCSNERTYY